MSQENVEALRAVYEEWAKGNLSAGGDLYDREILFIPPAVWPEAGTYRGPQGAREFLLGWSKAWTNLTVAAEEFIEAENSVIVAARQRGVGTESGASTESRYFMVWTFRGRVVIRIEAFLDRAEALEAVGLSE